MNTEDNFFICPDCSSPSVSSPKFGTENYECEVCPWVGPDPVLVPVNNPFGTKSKTFEAFAMELLTVVARDAALPIGRVLVKWGFVPTTKAGCPSPQVLARYLKASAGGAISGIIRERKAIEAER